jgi:hypothetical protein
MSFTGCSSSVAHAFALVLQEHEVDLCYECSSSKPQAQKYVGVHNARG